MKPEDYEWIRSLLANGWSQRAVEKEVFGYPGGAAWEAVSSILNGGVSIARPMAYNPTPGD